MISLIFRVSAGLFICLLAVDAVGDADYHLVDRRYSYQSSDKVYELSRFKDINSVEDARALLARDDYLRSIEAIQSDLGTLALLSMILAAGFGVFGLTPDIVREMVQPIIKGAGYSVGPVGILSLIFMSRSYPGSDETLISRLASKARDLGVWGCSLFDWRCLDSENQDQLRELEAKFLVHSSDLAEYISQIVVDEMYELRTKGGDFRKFRQQFFKIINFPTRVKEIEINEGVFSELANRYGSSIVAKLREIASQSKHEIEVKSDAFLPKKSLFFLGVAGTGKTELAKQFAKGIGLYACRISLAGLSPRDFVGSGAGMRYEGESFSTIELGRVAECLIKSKTLNPVIIFDDVDRSFDAEFLALFLDLVDPDKKTLPTPIGPVNIANIIVIFTGNFELSTEKNMSDKSHEMDALLQRFSLKLDFQGYSDGYKQKYLAEKLTPELSKTFCGGDIVISDQEVQTMIEQTIDEDISPGMRVLIESYKRKFHSLVEQKRKLRCNARDPVTNPYTCHRQLQRQGL